MIIKNKSTGESKGLGYVRYYKPSQAALAIENCDKGKEGCDKFLPRLDGGEQPLTATVAAPAVILSPAYRAILAEPRIKASSTEDYSGSASRGDYMGGGDTVTPYPPPLRKQLL